MMEDEINSIKSKNGNCNFSQKDMVWYLIAKVDKIYDKLDKKVDKKTFFAVLGIVVTIIVASRFI